MFVVLIIMITIMDDLDNDDNDRLHMVTINLIL